jgi:chromosome partitioning protein
MILCISNQKGGVGKTTTTINLSSCLTRMGYKVLMIDLDPQANLSSAYGIKDAPRNIYAAMVRDIPTCDAVIPLVSDKYKDKLYLIPGSYNFSRYEKLRAGEATCQYDLKKTIASIKGRFDYIVLDSPPALGLITVNALSCCDYVFVPIEAQLFSIDGLERLSKIINEIKEVINPSLELGGIFFVRHDKRKILNKEVEKFIKETYGGYLLETCIRESVGLREAPHEGKDIFSYTTYSTRSTHSNGAIDYELLTKELINRICKEKR